MWGKKMEYIPKWECDAVVEVVMREGEVVGLNPAGRVARGKCRDLRWGRKSFAIFWSFLPFTYCRVLYFAVSHVSICQSCCRVLKKKTHDKDGFTGRCLLCAFGRVQHTAKLFFGLCLVPLAHGKLAESRNALTSFSGFTNWAIKFTIYKFRTSNQIDTGHKVHYIMQWSTSKASFSHYITDEILSFVNDGIQYRWK
jgi:hypothetical protein